MQSCIELARDDDSSDNKNEDILLYMYLEYILPSFCNHFKL